MPIVFREFPTPIVITATAMLAPSGDFTAPLPPPADAAERKQRQRMSRSATLSAHTLHLLLQSLPARDDVFTSHFSLPTSHFPLFERSENPPATIDRLDLGYFHAVGASGADIPQLEALLHASMEDGHLSLHRLGSAGLRACNPLFAFQLMNNFTMCHGAILEGIGGPNQVFFSRGSGTTLALLEAAFALEEGLCHHALVGAADSALHPVTHDELRREGFIRQGLVPSEGAALLALTGGSRGETPNHLDSDHSLSFDGSSLPTFHSPLPTVLALRSKARTLSCCGIGTGETQEQLARQLLNATAPCDEVFLAPWGPPARDALLSAAPTALDLSPTLGEALAATPALAWILALDHLHTTSGRIGVLSAGVDGDVALSVFAK